MSEPSQALQEVCPRCGGDLTVTKTIETLEYKRADQSFYEDVEDTIRLVPIPNSHSTAVSYECARCGIAIVDVPVRVEAGEG